MRLWHATRFSLLPPAAAAIVLISAALASSSSPYDNLTAAASGPRHLQEILAVGAPAPGFEAGATVASVAEPPRIAADGSATFVVWVAMPTGAKVQAVYRVTAGSGGRPERVFRGGDPAPGAGIPFRGFPELPQTPRVEDGRLTFVASLEGVSGGAPRGGVWSDRSGAFDLLALQGEALPGMPAGAGIADLSLTTRQGAVLLRASWTSSGSIARADQGLWRNRSGGAGGWERVLSRGMPAPGLGSGVVFDGDPAGIFGPLFAFVPRGDGRVLAQAWVRGPGIDANNDEALWLESSTGLRTLVREGAAVTLGDRRGDATFGPTFNTPTFGSDGENATPAINDFGAVVFGAVLRTRNGRLNTVWTTRSGGLEPLARGGLRIDGFAPGDQAPGFATGVTFAAFAQSAINNRNEIALRGFTNESSLAADLREALWLDRPGRGMALVAKKGGAVPGLPGVTFTSLEMDTLTDDGAFYFSGHLAGTGVHAGNDRASFRVNPDDTVELLLREGGAVEVADAAGAVTARGVATFAFGPGVTPEGHRVLQAAFQDGRSGLYSVALPAGSTGGCTPFEVPERSCSDSLDNDCDGRVDAIDPDCQPTCRPAQSPCSRDSDCCSRQCRNRAGSRTCR